MYVCDPVFYLGTPHDMALDPVRAGHVYSWLSGPVSSATSAAGAASRAIPRASCWCRGPSGWSTLPKKQAFRTCHEPKEVDLTMI